MHQGLCNLRISSLIKVINTGFLHSAPHLNAAMVQKYLMPSPATSKGHMKRPCKGIRSTTPKPHKPTIASPDLPHLIPATPRIHTNAIPGLIGGVGSVAIVGDTSLVAGAG